MVRDPIGPEIERVITLLGRLPGLGPRSARRVALSLLKRPEALLRPLGEALSTAADSIVTCSVCGNLDTQDPCTICTDEKRANGVLCVVEDIADLWALERGEVFGGRYHVLGGVLSAIDGVGPEQLNLEGLIARASKPDVTEVILALN
ncbi:MAG: toprim domain-containing protein, partial [Pseudomonadota bacterium]